MTNEKRKKSTLEEVINQAVIATRLSCAREVKDVFKATEKRLYAYPVLISKTNDDVKMLEEVKQYGVHQKSHSITRFMRSGTRLDTDDIKQAVIIDLEAAIAADQHEINRIEKALAQIEDDEYQALIRYKYFEQKSEEEIAELMHCAPRTVRAHKARLVGRLSVFLYGAGALA